MIWKRARPSENEMNPVRPSLQTFAMHDESDEGDSNHGEDAIDSANVYEVDWPAAPQPEQLDLSQSDDLERATTEEDKNAWS